MSAARCINSEYFFRYDVFYPNIVELGPRGLINWTTFSIDYEYFVSDAKCKEVL